MPSPYLPGAIVKLLPEAKTQPPIIPRSVICHTNGGASSSTPSQLWVWQNRTDVVIESHFDVGLDGEIIQTMPVNVRADANYRANVFAISIETQDYGTASGPIDAQPWTAEQRDSIVHILTWCHREWGVPLKRCATWDSPGIGVHRDFPEWTASGHTCPGDARAAQFAELVAALNPTQEADMDPHRFIEASDGTIWEIGVDAKGQWAQTVDERGVDWRLYNPPTLGDPYDVEILRQHHRPPVDSGAVDVAPHIHKGTNTGGVIS